MASFGWVTYGIVLRTQIFVCVNSEPVWVQQSFVNLQLVDTCAESESFLHLSRLQRDYICYFIQCYCMMCTVTAFWYM